MGINYRLKEDDISYIFEHAEVDSIVVDAEFVHLLDGLRKEHPTVSLIVDTDTDGEEGEYDRAVMEGLSTIGKRAAWDGKRWRRRSRMKIH